MEINEALSKYKIFIINLYSGYFDLVQEHSKNENAIIENNNYFHLALTRAFTEGINNDTFKDCIIEKVLNEKDLSHLEVIYNNLTNEIKELKDRLKKFGPNFRYPFVLQVNKDYREFLFFVNLMIYEEQDGIRISQYIYSDDFFNEIQKNLDFTLTSINEIFRKKPIAETQRNDTPPQKEIKPIKWQKSSVLLAYLINELKEFGLIDNDGIWAICEQIFVDKNGIPIKAETFTSMVKNYENNHTPNGTKGKPKAHTEITELIKTLKALSKEI
jgi:hypothetical protein